MKEVENGATRFKATFVKINLQLGCMVLGGPSTSCQTTSIYLKPVTRHKLQFNGVL